MNISDLKEKIRKSKVIAVLRAPDHDSTIKLIAAFIKGGIQIIELTTSIPDWDKLLARAQDEIKSDAILGVGTVTNPSDVVKAVQNHASFIVSPYVDAAVIMETKKQGIMSIPGALTPSEVAKAYGFGADLVKVFPASSVGGPKYIKALLAPVPSWELIPTGGVTPENAKEYLDAGSFAVGLGSNLIPKEQLIKQDWNLISVTVNNFIDNLK
jgi:2-dehydro-3-deoxyphosphogluconate aldolase/(4S)-4-hydroxy-2-oxoglutarate aldolase